MKQLFVSFLIVFYFTSSEAHIYQYQFEKNIYTNNGQAPQSPKSEYIRIIEHPEMKGNFTYGLCKKVSDPIRSGEIIHTHDECDVIPGQYWWSMVYSKDPSVRSFGNGPKYLSDVLDEDNSSVASLFLLDGLLWLVGGWNGAAVATKIALRGFAKFMTEVAVAWAANSTFWAGAKNVTDAFNADLYDRTIPYTRTEIWSGQKDLFLDARPEARVTMKQCIETCIKQRDKDDIHNPTPLKMRRSNKALCEESCEAEGHPEFPVPSIPELWTLMAAYLIQTDNNEYTRILYDFKGAMWPFDSPNLKITYVSPWQLQSYISRKDPNYKGICPIGSECDKKYPMLSMDIAGTRYKKMPLNQLLQNYSPAVFERLAGHQDQNQICVYNSTYEQMFCLTKYGNKINPKNYAYELWLDLDDLFADTGTYYIRFKIVGSSAPAEFYTFKYKSKN